uniref:ATP synthase complex subunit 8 n=1 Tax=Plica plica TaxID=179265 RepID=C4T8A5_9SAUR|nr:ATPase subunit8 [Plica plica]
MPQLNPSPWFFILTITWMILIFSFLSKTVNSKHLKTPTLYSHKMKTTSHWTWPWF